MNTAIYWFRNDLRLHDNEAFHVCTENYEFVIPVYIFDPLFFKKDQFGFQRTAKFRAKFLIESIIDLKDSLRSLGSDLMVFYDDPKVVFEKLKNELNATAVFGQKEISRDEIEQEKAIENQFDCQWIWGKTLLHLDDQHYGISKIPEIYTAFRKRNEKHTKIRGLFEAPKYVKSPQLPITKVPVLCDFELENFEQPEHSAFPFKGGEKKALERLKHYIWETDHVQNYKHTRNGLIGTDYSSKFSPWLANGCLSPRMIYHEIKKYEEEVKKNQSTYWMIFELFWRDYFQFIGLKHQNRLFLKNGIRNNPNPQNKLDFEKFEIWKEGSTKDPFVNANLIELNETGWMSNRGRQNVASYLVHDMKLDWRLGAAYFESLLIDYDVCSNYGNWQYVAGVGNDPRENRKFDTRLQRERYDPDFEFVNLWNKAEKIST
ncbi:MAG: DASH family cryptochrome [Flavobacteriales bacterium]|nr:DASH family cryptochrome [Flavobacteriales bacterium]